jgi:hypothetical protein
MSHVSAMLVLQELNEELLRILTPEKVEVLNALHPDLARKGDQYLEGVLAATEYLALVDAAADHVMRKVSREHFLEVLNCRMNALHDIPPHNNAQEISY